MRIRNGEVCYWPNLGYGRFGAKVTMDTHHGLKTDRFDPRRMRLADIDGSAPTTSSTWTVTACACTSTSPATVGASQTC